MKRIPLTQGQFALVDDEDFERVNVHKWYAHWCRSIGYWYATRQERTASGKPRQRMVSMHREVVGATGTASVDHRNHDTLDNRRGNLRICTNEQNQANRLLGKANSSGFKGVSWDKNNKLWTSQICAGGRKLHIGQYSSPVDAAKAYDAAALKYRGEFALTNKALGLLSRKSIRLRNQKGPSDD